MDDNKKFIYSRIVIINREGKSQIAAFLYGQEKEAEEFFERASTQWPDSFLYKVLKGPFC